MNHTEVEQMMRDLGCDGEKITSAGIADQLAERLERETWGADQ
jgi:hypothetical protein